MNERRGRFVLVAIALALAALAAGLGRQRARSSTEVAPRPEASQIAPASPAPRVEPGAGAAREALDGAAHLIVHGHVLTTSRQPVADVHVHAWCTVSGGARRALGQATSDAQGRYRIEADLARLDLVAERGAWIELLAAAAPHGVAVRTHLEPELRPGTLELELLLDSGTLFVGRVVDEDGAPVAGARVAALREPSGERTPGETQTLSDEEWDMVASIVNNLPARGTAEVTQERTAKDGSFVLRSSTTGRVRVAARLEGFGSAISPWFDGASGRRELGDLVLRGPGRLAGTLRDAKGAPVGGVQLVALPPALAQVGPGSPEVTDWRLAHEAGAGLVVGRVTTAEDGSFELAGLAAGAFWIRPQSPKLVLEPVARPFATGDEEIELVLATRVLALRVVDDQGHGIAGVRVQCGTVERGGPDGVARLVASAERDTDDQGHTEFLLPPDRRGVGVFAAHPLHGSADLELALDRARTELELRLSARAEPASLRVRIRGAPDEVLPWYRVELFAELTGALAVSFRILPRSNEAGSSLPAGRYRLRLAPDGVYFGAGDQVPFLAPSPVELVAGEETLIELAPRHGGRVEVRYLGEENAVENSAALRFELTDGASAPRALHFVQVRKDEERSRGRRERLQPGETGLSEPQQPGLYTLRVLAGEALIDTRSVAVVAGVVARVELER